MGKDLHGRLLDKGITQEKSGLYVARYVDRFGKRQSKRLRSIRKHVNGLLTARILTRVVIHCSHKI